MTTRTPAIPEDQYQHLLDCYRSGQIEESAWQEHLQDKGFSEWVEAQAEPSKEPEPLAPEQLTTRLRVKADWLGQPEITLAYRDREEIWSRLKDAAVDHREAADRIDSDTALIGELVEALAKVERSLSRYKAPKPDYYALIGPIRSALTRARKRTGGA